MKIGILIKTLIIIGFISLSSITLQAACAGCETEEKETEVMNDIYHFSLQDIDGAPVSLSKYKGSVLLIVNVASKCGRTPQYKGLVELYNNYKAKGFEVLGFPANNFMGQEPGTNAEIKTFCSMNYGVEFPMFSKISVKGDDIHPLYKYLTGEATNPGYSGDIGWNFTKFLVDQNGKVIARFESGEEPTSEKIIGSIESALASE